MSGKNSHFSGGEWWCVIRCSFFNCYNVHAVLWYFLFVLCHVNVARCTSPSPFCHGWFHFSALFPIFPWLLCQAPLTVM